MPKRVLSPNEKYTALVAAAGYLPQSLSAAGVPVRLFCGG